jgi:hypothetical protein
MPCAATEPRTVEPPRGTPVQIFLLCAGSLVSVDRAVHIPEGAKDGDRRVLVAQSLLGQLGRRPWASERLSGYTTNVDTGTKVTGPHKGDPTDTLRLSTAPDGLSSYALGQIVCTFSDSAATEEDGSVILGGPDEGAPLRYTCTPEVRTQPGSHRPPATDVDGG